MKTTKATILILLGVLLVLPSAAQTEAAATDQWYNRLYVEGQVEGLHGNKSINTFALNTKVGYFITPNLKGFAQAELSFGLMDDVKINLATIANPTGAYYSSNAIGAGLAYQFQIRNGYFPFRTIDLHAGFGTTIGHFDWKYNCYEVGLTFGVGVRRNLILGCGYRLSDSRTHGIKTQQGVFATIGFRF